MTQRIDLADWLDGGSREKDHAPARYITPLRTKFSDMELRVLLLAVFEKQLFLWILLFRLSICCTNDTGKNMTLEPLLVRALYCWQCLNYQQIHIWRCIISPRTQIHVIILSGKSEVKYGSRKAMRRRSVLTNHKDSDKAKLRFLGIFFTHSTHVESIVLMSRKKTWFTKVYYVNKTVYSI